MSTDSELMAASVEAPDQFSEIFERHARAVGGYVRRRIGEAGVDDALSETFLVAFRRRGSFDASSDSARPWLLGIATRVMKRHRASEAAQWRAFEHASGAVGAAVDDGQERAADDRLDASRAVRELAPRIAALSRKDRDTLLLYAWGGLTYEQVARALDVPVGTVRSRLNRVRKRLSPTGSDGQARLTWMAKGENDAAYGTRA